jgi:hypothetical protein
MQNNERIWTGYGYTYSKSVYTENVYVLVQSNRKYPCAHAPKKLATGNHAKTERYISEYAEGQKRNCAWDLVSEYLQS